MFRQLCLATALLAAVPSGAPAQHRGSRRNTDAEASGSTDERSNRLDRIAGYLKLSSEQKKRFKEIMDAGQREAAPLRDQMIESRAQLAAAITGGQTAAEIGKANRGYGALEARMAAVELKAFAQIFKLLDAGQQEKIRPVFVMMNGVFRNRNWIEMQ